MARFSMTEAAFEGFRLTREHPRAVVAWSLAYFVFTLAIALLTVAWVGKDMAALQALSQQPNPDPHEAATLFGRLAPYFLVVLPAETLFPAVLVCAIYRAVLRPFERGLGYFKLGADELRMVALSLIVVAFGLLTLFVVIFILVLTAETLGASGGAVGAFLGGVIGAGALGLPAWIFVRLSLAVPMTFDQRRLVVFDSWSFTKGVFWPLAGAYLLAIALGIVILLLMAVISAALVGVAVLATGGVGSFGQSFQAGVSSIGALMTVPAILWQILWSGALTVFYIIVLSPAAIAYQGLSLPEGQHWA